MWNSFVLETHSFSSYGVVDFLVNLLLYSPIVKNVVKTESESIHDRLETSTVQIVDSDDALLLGEFICNRIALP